MQIDLSDSHRKKASFSIRESLEPDSNVKLSSPLQHEKQDSHIISTDEGIQIDFSDEQHEKVRLSIRMRLDGNAKVTLPMSLRGRK
jgi:hypothetical protein